MKAVARYCPFDLLKDPARLDLKSIEFASAFGRMNVVVSSLADGSDSCTLLLHGVGATWADWTPVLQQARLEGQDLGDVVIPDLPGFGQSQNLLNHLEIGTVGDELLRLVERLGYSRIRLVGHSMGGFLALDMASHRHPQIRSLHLVAGAYFSIIDVVRNPIAHVCHRPTVAVLFGSMYVLSIFGSVGVNLTHIIGQTPLADLALKPFVARPRDLKPSIKSALLDDPRPSAFLQAARNGETYQPEVRWAAIDVPTYGVFGADDHLVPPSDMERLAEVLPAARLTLLDNAAHLVHIEQPAQALQMIRDGSGG